MITNPVFTAPLPHPTESKSQTKLCTATLHPHKQGGVSRDTRRGLVTMIPSLELGHGGHCRACIVNVNKAVKQSSYNTSRRRGFLTRFS
eukprot:g29893.t1